MAEPGNRETLRALAGEAGREAFRGLRRRLAVGAALGGLGGVAVGGASCAAFVGLGLLGPGPIAHLPPVVWYAVSGMAGGLAAGLLLGARAGAVAAAATLVDPLLDRALGETSRQPEAGGERGAHAGTLPEARAVDGARMRGLAGLALRLAAGESAALAVRAVVETMRGGETGREEARRKARVLAEKAVREAVGRAMLSALAFPLLVTFAVTLVFLAGPVIWQAVR